MDNQMRVALSPPWETYVKELTELFRYDKDVKVLFDRESSTANVYVDDQYKAEALAELLNDEIDFGGKTLTINIIPSNRKMINGKGRDNWTTAFAGNAVLTDIKYVSYPFGTFTYLMWSLKPAQFFNDNLGDFYGNKTVLFEDIARDVFKPATCACHCTESYKE